MTLSSPLKESLIQQQLKEQGFTTTPFSVKLRTLMLTHIDAYIRELGSTQISPDKIKSSSLEQIALSIPDDVWAQKMSRAFRIFPKKLSEEIYQWADHSLCKKLGRERSAVNVVYPQEAETNPAVAPDNLAIYWRCVRPGKPDAGRPHRDASFWDLEFKEGFDPKIPFSFDYIKDIVKVWIPLSGCVPTTTLQIIPYSHKIEIPTIVEPTEYGRRPSISSDWLKIHEKEFMSPVELSNGSCLLFDMNLVHRGPQHNHRELRISAELNFFVQ